MNDSKEKKRNSNSKNKENKSLNYLYKRYLYQIKLYNGRQLFAQSPTPPPLILLCSLFVLLFYLLFSYSVKYLSETSYLVCYLTTI